MNNKKIQKIVYEIRINIKIKTNYIMMIFQIYMEIQKKN